MDEVDEETLHRPQIDHVWTIKVPASPPLLRLIEQCTNINK